MKAKSNKTKGNVGILVGGGPAPGLNGVIAAATIAARQNDNTVYGIYDGYKWLVKGKACNIFDHVMELRIKDVSRIHYEGGSILRTSRTNPAKVENGVKNSVINLRKLGIKYMVTTGGDDTAYGASQIAHAAEGEIKFVHVPKTIDNDLPLPFDLPTFGYQTARDLGANLVKNLMEDARTMNRWYIVVAMGRHSGHLALGMGKSAGATLTIIPEEFEKEKHIPVEKVCDILEGAIIKRRAMGHDHGVMVIAEGVGARLSHEELKKIPGVIVEYDNFGNLQLSEVELGKIIKLEVERRFRDRGDKCPLVEINIGYELRCAPPIPFDQEYTRDLGYNAINYLFSNDPKHQKNAMICTNNGTLIPLYFEDMINPQTQKTEVRYVDIKSPSYLIACKYMIRLEKRDFADAEFLEKLVKASKMTKDNFIKKFGYMAD
jgi:ATP-dependent phosphofructokinase / diphosphate-dependent phosphofructokinase